jgi:hypothetical protein
MGHPSLTDPNKPIDEIYLADRDVSGAISELAEWVLLEICSGMIEFASKQHDASLSRVYSEVARVIASRGLS